MTVLPAFRRLGLLWLPLLLVLLARIAVAPGWMMEVGESGSISVRICSDPDRVGTSIAIPIERGGDHAPDSQQHCSWGALAEAPPVPAQLTLTSPPPAPKPRAKQLFALGFAPGIASPLPPSTGPPAFA
jgi:hypothetical protein